MKRYRLLNTDTWCEMNTQPIFAVDIEDAARKVQCTYQLTRRHTGRNHVEYYVYKDDVKLYQARLEEEES